MSSSASTDSTSTTQTRSSVLSGAVGSREITGAVGGVLRTVTLVLATAGPKSVPSVGVTETATTSSLPKYRPPSSALPPV